MRSNPSPTDLAHVFPFLRPRLVRSLKDYTKEDEEKEMVGANSSQSRTRTYYPRKCKNTRLMMSIHECIPDEILFQILLHLPAQDIYYSSRLVCWKWYRIMCTKTFTHKHLEHASYGLLYKGESDVVEAADVIFISPRQDAGGGIFETYKLANYLRIGTVWSSCNGLMLEVAKHHPHTVFFVTNVLTNQAFRLPPYPYPLLSSVANGIGYDAASMTYKVVISPYTITTPEIGCGILTVGVDKSWRRIRTDHLSDLGKRILGNYSILTEGFLHWKGSTQLVSLNLETEIITEAPLPIPRVVYVEEKIECHCISTGRFLSLFLQRKKFVWEVFEMKPETGEWRKLPNISLEGQKGVMERLGFKLDNVVIKPCGWLKYPEVLALRIQSVFIIFYNLITMKSAPKSCALAVSFSPLRFTRTAWYGLVDPKLYMFTPH